MNKNKLSDNMKTLEKLLWKYASFGIIIGTLKHSVVNNSNNEPMAWVVDTVRNTSAKPLDELVAKLNKAMTIDFEIYRHNSKKIYIIPTVTDDEKYAMLELKAYIVGEEVLEAQKKVLETKQKWLQPLKDLAEAKKQREAA